MPLSTLVEAVRSIPDVVPSEDRTLGWSALEWTYEYLLQPDGPSAGEPWTYTDEQARIVLRWYAIDDRGRFVWRRGALRRMKGWGKDPFLASLAALELCGPCRFGGWDAAGKPVSIQHPMPWVQVAAVALSQTRNTMLLFPRMFSPAAVDEFKIDPGKEVIYARGAGQIQAVTSSPTVLEGNRGSFIIANEPHLWLKNNSGLEMAQVIKRNLAKARDGEARVMEITNAHMPGEGSAAEETYEAWRAGKLSGVYYDSLEAPELPDISDTERVKAGLMAARGDSIWLDVDRLLEEIADPTTPEWLSRRYYLNQVTAVDAEKWIPESAWKVCGERRAIPDGVPVVLGFDGSRSEDATGIVVVEIGEVPHLDVVKLWEKGPDDPPEWKVPIEDVEDEIRAACKRWKVKEISADAYLWARSLELLGKERLPVAEFPQSPSRMIPATKRFAEAVFNSRLTHSGNKDLARHVSNAVLKVSSRGAQIYKDAEHSPRKIDLAVASIMAVERASAFTKRRRTDVVDLAEALRRAAAREKTEGKGVF